MLRVRRSNAERPSPLWVCSILNNNKLNGSVPSSLSALCYLQFLCVPPSCQRRFCSCGRGGWDRSALLRARGMSGVYVERHQAKAVREQGCCGALTGDLGHAMRLRSTQGAPLLWGTVRGYRRGTRLLWVRRSTAERPSPLRVCSDLHSNALNGIVPSSLSALIRLELLCMPPSSRCVCACGRGGSDRSALLRARGMSGVHVWRHRVGAVRQQGMLRCSQRGPLGMRCD